MRIAQIEDVPALQDLYSESARHANKVGHIDWPDQFEESYLNSLVLAREIYCFEDEGQLTGAVRLAEKDPPPVVWEEQKPQHLYIGKLATADAVRGQQYVSRILLPEIEREGRLRNKVSLRLTCLGDNPKLIEYYSGLGFERNENTTMFSEFYNAEIEIARFERNLE